MSILVNKNSRILVQGITGREGSFHTMRCMEYGTNVVAGVTPGRGGTLFGQTSIPVFNTVEEAVAATNPNVSLIFVCVNKSFAYRNAYVARDFCVNAQ